MSVEHTWQCRCQERSLLRGLGISGFRWEHAVAVLLCPSWRWTIVQFAVDVCRLLQGPIACVGIQDLHTKNVTVSTSAGQASAAYRGQKREFLACSSIFTMQPSVMPVSFSVLDRCAIRCGCMPAAPESRGLCGHPRPSHRAIPDLKIMLCRQALPT